jgi:hypothetical protein
MDSVLFAQTWKSELLNIGDFSRKKGANGQNTKERTDISATIKSLLYSEFKALGSGRAIAHLVK